MPPQRRQSHSARPEGGIQCRLRADDVYEILAWLDYCVAKGFNPGKFRQSIVDHLKRSRQRDFTLTQIDQKIRNLWNYDAANYKPDQSDYSCVYRVGTKALRYLDHNDAAKKIVRTRVQQMMREPIFESFKPARKRSRRERTVRHISPGVEVESRSFPKAKRALVELPLHSTLETFTQKSSTKQVPPTPSKAPEDSQSRDSYVTVSAVPDSEHLESLSSPMTSSASSMVEDPPTLDASCLNVKPEIFLTPPKKLIQLNSMQSLTRTPYVFAEDNSSCNLSDCETIRQLLADRERDVQYLRLEWSKAQDTIKDLERKLQCEEHRRAILAKACGDLAEKTLKGYLNEIEILRSKLKDKESLCPFTTRAGKKHIPFDETYFQANMDIIRNVIEDFMSYAETSKTCNNIEFEEQADDLRLLFQRVVGESEGTLQSVSFQSLLRSLLSAAVCEWVFECDVQEHFLASTPLRETMLSHLITQDGEDVARNLDFAAHHTLIESEYFQEALIRRRAEALAVRISATIAPLFGLQKPLALWEVDILTEWNRKRPELEKMFVSALRIKTRALVSKDMFEVVFPPQAYKYDRGFMEVEKLERDSGESLLGQTSLVRLCLVPGLRKYAFDRKLVDYNSFQKPGSGLEGPSDLIAGPIVVID